ncbi:hypothetical protein BH23ACT10_BH23ACT10_21550 [soil metagenome]
MASLPDDPLDEDDSLEPDDPLDEDDSLELDDPSDPDDDPSDPDDDPSDEPLDLLFDGASEESDEPDEEVRSDRLSVT